VLDLELLDHPIVSADIRGVLQRTVGEVRSGSSSRDEGLKFSVLGDGTAARCPNVINTKAEATGE